MGSIVHLTNCLLCFRIWLDSNHNVERAADQVRGGGGRDGGQDVHADLLHHGQLPGGICAHCVSRVAFICVLCQHLHFHQHWQNIFHPLFRMVTGSNFRCLTHKLITLQSCKIFQCFFCPGSTTTLPRWCVTGYRSPWGCGTRRARRTMTGSGPSPTPRYEVYCHPWHS